MYVNFYDIIGLTLVGANEVKYSQRGPYFYPNPYCSQFPCFYEMYIFTHKYT